VLLCLCLSPRSSLYHLSTTQSSIPHVFSTEFNQRFARFTPFSPSYLLSSTDYNLLDIARRSIDRLRGERTPREVRERIEGDVGNHWKGRERKRRKRGEVRREDVKRDDGRR
jgi:hypothetical protein